MAAALFVAGPMFKMLRGAVNEKYKTLVDAFYEKKEARLWPGEDLCSLSPSESASIKFYVSPL